jgi:hypothetical protein
MIYLFSILFLIVGVLAGWTAAERYIAFMQYTEHEHEELFRENPHPELFDSDGEINRGDYITMMFEPGFDPDEWDPETDIYRD